ncbi:MAG: alpha-L-fucosidase [Solirubrobacterales bacterium]
MKKWIGLAGVACLTAMFLRVEACRAAETRYEPNWASIDKRPTPQWWVDAKFGIFIHWGLYAVPAWSVRGEYSEWYWNRIMGDKAKNGPWWQYHAKTYGADFPYSEFAPQFKAELYDPNQWADIFLRSGAKYIVLTSKHHDGFCLWPSQEANKSWGRPWNSVDIGPGRDLLGDLTTAVRAKGIHMGFYYSLYEWYNPLWVTDRAMYVDKHMFPQFKDLVTRYKPEVIFSDGEWDMHSKEWRSEELMAWLFNESPVKDSVVIDDRWGKDSRHKHGGYYTTEYGAGLSSGAHPWEECRGMGHSFGYSRTEALSDYRSAREMVLMLVDIVSRGGNLLLDIGPAADGTIPVIMEERLTQIGDWLKVNGEAIYGTRTWKNTIQWTDGKRPEVGYGKEYMAKYDIAELTGKPTGDKAVIEAFFTTKDGTLYVITPRWPGEKLVVKDVEVAPNTAVTMLGVAQSIRWDRSGSNLTIQVPALSADEVPCQYAYVFKITGVK